MQLTFADLRSNSYNGAIFVFFPHCLEGRDLSKHNMHISIYICVCLCVHHISVLTALVRKIGLHQQINITCFSVCSQAHNELPVNVEGSTEALFVIHKVIQRHNVMLNTRHNAYRLHLRWQE